MSSPKLASWWAKRQKESRKRQRSGRTEWDGSGGYPDRRCNSGAHLPVASPARFIKRQRLTWENITGLVTPGLLAASCANSLMTRAPTGTPPLTQPACDRRCYASAGGASGRSTESVDLQQKEVHWEATGDYCRHVLRWLTLRNSLNGPLSVARGEFKHIWGPCTLQEHSSNQIFTTSPFPPSFCCSLMSQF